MFEVWGQQSLVLWYSFKLTETVTAGVLFVWCSWGACSVSCSRRGCRPAFSMVGTCIFRRPDTVFAKCSGYKETLACRVFFSQPLLPDRWSPYVARCFFDASLTLPRCLSNGVVISLPWVFLLAIFCSMMYSRYLKLLFGVSCWDRLLSLPLLIPRFRIYSILVAQAAPT